MSFLKDSHRCRAERLLAPLGVGDDLVGANDEVVAEIGERPAEQLVFPAALEVDHRGAFVQLVVAELGEVLRAHDVVVGVPHVHEVPEVQVAEVEVAKKRRQADHQQQAIAEDQSLAGSALLGQLVAPTEHRHRDASEAELHPLHAGVFVESSRAANTEDRPSDLHQLAGVFVEAEGLLGHEGVSEKEDHREEAQRPPDVPIHYTGLPR